MKDLLDKPPEKKVGSQLHTGTIVGIVLAVLFIAVIILAGIYISSNPTSSAALFFLKVSFRNSSGLKYYIYMSLKIIVTKPFLLEIYPGQTLL